MVCIWPHSTLVYYIYICDQKAEIKIQNIKVNAIITQNEKKNNPDNLVTLKGANEREEILIVKHIF